MVNCAEQCNGTGYMYLHFSTSVTILFEKWTVSTVGGLIGSCLAIVALAFVVEGLAFLRKKLIQKFATDVHHRLVEKEATESSRLVEEQAEGQIPFLSCGHCLLTALYGMQNCIFYLLMLVVMTGNAYLLIAVVVGAALGYFSFAWRMSVAVNVISEKKK